MWVRSFTTSPTLRPPACLDDDSPIVDLDYHPFNLRNIGLLHSRVPYKDPEGHNRLGVEFGDDFHPRLELFESSLMVPHLDVGPLAYHQPKPTAPVCLDDDSPDR